MIYHLIEYYRIPHPLLREKGYIAVSDPEVFSKKCFRVWIDDKKSIGDAELPRITRVLLTPHEIKETEGERLVRTFEKNAKIQHERSFNILKLKIFLRFTSACAVGYFIYWTVYNLPWVWVPVNLFLEKILGDTLTGIFQGVVIALAPGLSFIKNFVGAKRYGRINFRSKYTKIIPGFDKTSRRYFAREVKKCLTNIKESAEKERVEFDTTCLEKITEEIINKPAVDVDFARDWLSRFEKILEELSERAKEEDFFEGVVLKLDRLKEDLLLNYLKGFKMVPLKIVTPSSKPEEAFPSLLTYPDLASAILAKGCIQKAKNLREFVEITSDIREKIYLNFNSLKQAKDKRERIRFLKGIEEGFELLRNAASNFHFGDNPSIPYERGENLSNLFHRLYQLFGQARLDIEKERAKVRGVFLRYLKLSSEFLQKRRIKKLMLDVERILCQGVETGKCREKTRCFFSFFGADLKRSIFFSLVVFFLFTCLFGFKVIQPGQVLTATYLRWAVKETETQKVPLFSQGLKVLRFGEGLKIFPGRELFWHLPPPLVFTHKIDFKKPSTFTSYLIFSAPADTLYKRGLKWLAGAYGGYYQVIQINFNFLVKDEEMWIKYDYDGKGPLRLSRDVAPLVDEWRGELFDFEKTPLVNLEDGEEMENIFSGSYFRKLWESGRIREIIKSQIFRNPLLTYQYGTYSEMINPGLELVLQSIRREKEKIKMGFLQTREKEKRLKMMEEFEIFVKKVKEDALNLAREEYGILRKEPYRLKKYLSDPESISELREFETVWLAVQRTMLYEYATEKLVRIIRGEFGEKKKQEILNMLVDKIQKNPYFSNFIHIKDVKTKVLFIDSHGYRSLLSKITREII